MPKVSAKRAASSVSIVLSPPVRAERAPRKLGLAAGASTDESCRWFERAKQSLAGGVSSSARATTAGALPYPLFITHGRGSRVWDADGNEFVDYLLSYGSTILGHCHPALVETVAHQLDLGTMFGTCNTVEVELAELICRLVPCAELVRFANSGSEAIQGAVRAARGFTGRNKVLKFEGHYHGWVDVLAVSNRPTVDQAGPLDAPHSQPHSRGTPGGVVDDVVIAPWNDPARLLHLLDLHGHELAAVIAEPVVANNACIMPKPGFLETLRDECTRRGIMLIYDEIVTGFRLAPGGAQQVFGVIPDLAVFSKALGGGFPLSAFAGRRAVMEPIAANTVKHGGTYNGNPICAAAALQTLRSLVSGGLHEQMDEVGNSAIEAIRRSAKDRGVPVVVQGFGTMFQAIFGTEQPLSHYRDLLSADTKRYAAFQRALLEQGIHANASGSACWFVSASHTTEDVQITAAAIERAMRTVS